MKKQTKEKRKTSVDYAIAVIFILAVTAIIYIACMMLSEDMQRTSYASSDTTYEDLNQENNINSNGSYIQTKNEVGSLSLLNLDVNEIIQSNIQTLKREEIIKEEIDLEYNTKYTNNPDLPKGMLQVLQEGIDGKQEVYIKKIYEGEELIKEEQFGNKITKSSVDKLVSIGTGAYTSDYKVKKGDTLYVTSNLLAIRIEAKDNATKLISLNKNAQVKLLDKKGEWYKVQYQSYIGWAKAECFTYLDPNSTKVDTANKNTYSKQQLLKKLSFNMKLNQPSGLSLEQFKKIFANESKDKNKVFKNNAEYFYYAEKQYNINGVFLASIAIHESGWAGSKISLDKKNLFGYGAYDRSPYASAYKFSEYSEGIDMVARVLVKYYLNPKGTKIYSGNTATGTYYNGPTLSGVNKKYATDKNWANGVYSWMKYLYNNL